MRYTKFAISKAISAIKNNRFLNVTIDVIYAALGLLFKIVFSPIGAAIAFIAIGFYMFPIIIESMSTSIISTNMSSATSVTSVLAASDALSSSAGILPILIIAIAGLFPLLFVMRLISGDDRGGML